MLHPMSSRTTWLCFSLGLCGSVGCHIDGDDPAADTASAVVKAPRSGIEQVAPPLDLKTPPPDATKTRSGLVLAKLVTNDVGERPSPSDTALVQYTGWRQSTGDTFFTTKGRARPIAIDIAHAAPGFTEALPLLHKGETAMLWVPPSPGTPETVVYQIEVVDIVVPPATTTRRAPAAHPVAVGPQ